MKVWVTKYALTQGILEKEVEICSSDVSGHMIKITGTGIGWSPSEYYYGNGKEWHETKESAIKMAEFMRLKKIESLKKQIIKLEKMKFE